MLQHDQPDDYVVATGETHSVREFVEAAFGAGLDWQRHVEFDARYSRRRKSICSRATHRKPHDNWAGGPRSTSRNSWK